HQPRIHARTSGNLGIVAGLLREVSGMRRMYEDVLRQMEQDSRDLFWHLVRATAPEKFWQPPLDVYETGCAFKIKVEVAGVRREDLHVDLSPDGRTVTVRGL